ncbi:MAG: hypothetical protein H7Z21_20540 [Hymenobacter sp.]|nr:hypothetical protein [Hymenobacter sp.]
MASFHSVLVFEGQEYPVSSCTQRMHQHLNHHGHPQSQMRGGLAYEKGYRSLPGGTVSPSGFATDVVLNYGFGQATRLSGFDNWFRSPEANSLLNEARYRASLQLSPRLAQGVGAVLPEVLETGNWAASTAVRKVGQEETKKHLPK